MRRCVVGSLRSVRGPVALLAAGLATMSLVAVSASPADAATDSVTTCAGSGAGSLPAVVSAALPNDVITFAVTCPPGSPILLTGGTIDISKNLTIQGPGPSQLAVDGQDAVQDFHVDAGYSVTISGITIQNGHIGCGGFCSGAGVENEGTLALTDDVVTNNSVKCGGSCGADGGGVENDTGGTLAITDSTITDNTVSAGCGMGDSCGAYGGGVENQAGGTLTVTDSTISDNTTNPAGGGGNCYQYCTGSGAGIDNNGKATVSFSTVSGNQADNSCTQYCGPDGGGIDNESPGTLTLFNSTVAANQANTGCDQYCGAAGGGIYNSGSATVSNATVSGNSVSGGCTTPPGDCGNIASDIDFHDGNLTITATIVANGTGATDCAGTFETDDGYNLDDDGSCGFSTANNDLPDTPSGLDPAGLQDNGGPTQTIELEATSAAVDHVAAAFCPATDQRHSPRVAPCDIGAYDTDGALMDGSQVHDVIEVKTSPSYAGDPVHIDSSQLQESCEGTITFETLQGGTTRAPRTSIDSITVVLDDDGDATVVVDGSPCAPGSDVVEADLDVAPYYTALGTLVAEPPVVTTAGVYGYPTTAGPSPPARWRPVTPAASGNSDVYAVFYVETDPVYAEQRSRSAPTSSRAAAARDGPGLVPDLRGGEAHRHGGAAGHGHPRRRRQRRVPLLRRLVCGRAVGRDRRRAGRYPHHLHHGLQHRQRSGGERHLQHQPQSGGRQLHGRRRKRYPDRLHGGGHGHAVRQHRRHGESAPGIIHHLHSGGQDRGDVHATGADQHGHAHAPGGNGPHQ
jgi:hypothetical protein